jgi:hypothetical protein
VVIQQLQNVVCEFQTINIYSCIVLQSTKLIAETQLQSFSTRWDYNALLYFVAVCQRRAWLTVCIFDPPVHLVQDLYHLLTIGIALVLHARCFMLLRNTIRYNKNVFVAGQRDVGTPQLRVRLLHSDGRDVQHVVHL